MVSTSSKDMRLALLFTFLACAMVTAEPDVSARKLLASNTGSSISVRDRNTVLSQMNSVRAKYQAAPLKWSNSVAASAQGSANTCKMAHNMAELQQRKQGENLYGTTAGIDWPTAVTAWTSESQSYNFKNPGFSESTGHFTQVVWGNTQTVGCGYTACPGTFNIYSCRYYPAGNFIGQFAQQVKAPRG